MNYRVHIVVNDFEEEPPIKIANNYLTDSELSFSRCIPECPSLYDLIILWNIRTVLKELPNTSNIVVFHSSDLPKGRGWAPIYYAIANSQQKHTITAILASEKVDSGDIICKGTFSILKSYLADDLRKLDEIVCFVMAKKILDKFQGRKIIGYPQVGSATYNKRRYPEDSKIDITKSLSELIPHIKACSFENPACFQLGETHFNIRLESSTIIPTIPNDLVIKFDK